VLRLEKGSPVAAAFFCWAYARIDWRIFYHSLSLNNASPFSAKSTGTEYGNSQSDNLFAGSFECRGGLSNLVWEETP
jgi:hypothetical protein